MASAPAMPPGFGIARIEETGTSSHELLYEHEYQPEPIRQLSEIESVAQVNGTMLRPAVRNGKVDFRFYGNRVPLSADHARSWLGHLLLSEQQKGTIAHVELLIRRYQDVRELSPDDPAGSPKRHPEQQSWLWDVWPADASAGGMKNGRMGRPGVELLMKLSPEFGISLELFCIEEAPRTAVCRVLKQYCDDGCGQVVWRPIPDPPARISKVVDREMSKEVRRKRAVGLKLEETGSEFLSRALEEMSNSSPKSVDAKGIQAAEPATSNVVP